MNLIRAQNSNSTKFRQKKSRKTNSNIQNQWHALNLSPNTNVGQFRYAKYHYVISQQLKYVPDCLF